MNSFKPLWPVALLAVLVVGAFSLHNITPPFAFAESGSLASTKIGPPKVAKRGQQTATFAAGCFWSMEAIFSQLKGVASVEPGYSGGKLKNPTYEHVEQGNTGHAETINIIFDPKVISYSDLLDVLLTIRNPTTQDQQGPDVGPQYRSVIFTRDAQQKKEAQEAIQRIGASGLWNAPLVTQIAPYSKFYRAEDYHLNYYNLHPQQGYCAAVVAPEIAEFREKFKSKLK